MKSFWKAFVEWLRALRRGEQLPPPGKATGPAGARVYHEIILADEPDSEGRWAWSARVYGASAQGIMEANSSHASRDLAQAAALKWCDGAKQRMRGLG